MTYPYSYPGRYTTQSPTAYGAHSAQLTGTAYRRTSPANQLLWVVVALGLATYLVSYGAVPQPGATGWDVRFSTLAAVLAALGLPSRQSAHTKSVAALSVMGFLEALSRLITGDQHPNWAAIVIVVLNTVQALTAIVALLCQRRGQGTADGGLTPYDAYAYYAQAAQQYYGADNQQLLKQQPVQAQGTAQAEAGASAQAQQSAAERYALYAEYLTAQQSGPSAAASSPQTAERTQTTQSAPGAGIPTSGPAESIQPGYDTETRWPTQSP